MPNYRTPLPSMLASLLQAGLNTVLSFDASSRSRQERLQGRTLKLVLEGLGIELFFTSSDHGMEVSVERPAGDAEAEADTTITGTPAALFSMAASELGEGWNAPGSKVSISGDAGLARDFERLFSKLDPDFEAAFAGLFGDVVGHQLAAGLREGARRARETADAAGEVFGEVLREGPKGGRSGPLIGAQEVRVFADGVDDLRDAVDRLEARVRMLVQESADSGGQQA